MESFQRRLTNFEAINNETQTIFNVVEGRGGEVQPVKLTSQSVAIHVELTEQLTKEAMVQEVLNMIERFNLSYQGKINLLKVILEKVYEIETERVASASIKFRRHHRKDC